jgi:hypothetical protein
LTGGPALTPFCSLFSQILKLFPRSEFQRLVGLTRAERHARGFTCWEQFVAMLFCHLGRAQSLREITDGLASAEGKLDHLGVRRPARSTLSYANEHRPWQLFEQLFYTTLERFRGQLHVKHPLRFKNPLLSLDATTIDLCASVFDWAHFRRTKGGVKLHLLLDHDGLLPCFALITEAKRHEMVVARSMDFPAGAVVVFDRAYNDYEWLRSLDQRRVWFVTRARSTTQYHVVEDRQVPQRGGIIRDQIIDLIKAPTYQFTPVRLRRIEFVAPEDGRVLVFLTNHLSFGATTIAAIYKQRWQVELMFKVLKQNLRIKTFVGTSANALAIQIWTALIAVLILRFLKLKARFGWSLSQLVAMLRFNLFTHRSLWLWLDEPFHGLAPPLDHQLALL